MPGGPEERLVEGLGAQPGARWETAAERDHKIGFRSLASKNSHLQQQWERYAALRGRPPGKRGVLSLTRARMGI